MLEIEKIKEFIQKHSDELAFEIYGEGGFAESVFCEIDYTDKENPMLYVTYAEVEGRAELFRANEKWFKTPTKRQLEKAIQNRKNQYNDSICHHWCIHTLKDGIEQLVLSRLPIDDYVKALEIYQKIYHVKVTKESKSAK